MKFFLVLFTFIFFTTQILPIKYLQYLCDDDYCMVDNDEENSADDNPCEKNKEKLEKETKFLFDNFPQLNTTETCITNFFIENTILPKNFTSSVITPPPNS